MRDRRMIITVPGHGYKLLAEEGRPNVRSPEQQAAYVVRQHIEALAAAAEQADSVTTVRRDPWGASPGNETARP
jgi:DNA-binding winged helix-turn-helix (wHTH) protein